MYETRRELLRKIQDLFTDLNQCEVALENKEKEPDPRLYTKYIDDYIDDQFPVRLGNIKLANEHLKRRLDRLEEMMYHLCDSIDKKEDDNTYYKLTDQQGFLKKKAKEIYEEQAAFRGDQDEWIHIWYVIYFKRNNLYIFNDNVDIMYY